MGTAWGDLNVLVVDLPPGQQPTAFLAGGGGHLDTFTAGRFSSKGLSLLDTPVSLIGLPVGQTFIGWPHTETVRRTQLPGAEGKAHCLLPKQKAPTLPWRCTILAVLACGWTVAAAVHAILAGSTV
jgi:hypothetical protein